MGSASRRRSFDYSEIHIMKGIYHENQPYALSRKDFRLRNLPHAKKGRSQSQILDVTAVALAHRLVPGLESLPGTPG
jgi:hypothetical protein